MKKRNIAIFQRDLKVGGIQKSLLTILKKIDLTTVNVDLYLFDQTIFYDDQIPEKVNVIFLKPEKSFTKFLPFELFKKWKKGYSIEKEYDVAIDFDSYQQATALGAISVSAKKRVLWIHNDVEIKIKEEWKYKILHHFFRAKYRYFDTFVGVSKGVIEPFKRVNQLYDKKYIVIPNFVDADDILTKSNVKIDFSVNREYYNLVSIGRLCHQKGYDILLEYFCQIIQKRKDIHLYLIGDGPDREKLERQVEKNHLEEYVTFLGNQTNPFQYAKEMDGFVLTSRYEGQGIVILEAKVLGLEIFIPKHLEPYNDGIPGREDIVASIIEAQKKPHQSDRLIDYNQDILTKLNTLFGIE